MKFTDYVYHKQRLKMCYFQNMCNLCRYAQFLHARSHTISQSNDHFFKYMLHIKIMYINTSTVTIMTNKALTNAILKADVKCT